MNVFVPEFVKPIFPVRVMETLSRMQLFNCVCRAEVTPLRHVISVGVAPENLEASHNVTSPAKAVVPVLFMVESNCV